MRRPNLKRMEMAEHPAVGYCRREVMDFAVLMERELRNNDHKGGWKECDAYELAQRVTEEANELLPEALQASIHSPVPSEFRDSVGEEAADVANMAMMVADVCGCLRR